MPAKSNKSAMLFLRLRAAVIKVRIRKIKDLAPKMQILNIIILKKGLAIGFHFRYSLSGQSSRVKDYLVERYKAALMKEKHDPARCFGGVMFVDVTGTH